MLDIETIITGVGGYLPERVVTNHDLAKTIDTSDEWIRSRSGIEQRHFAADDQATSDLAAAAAWNALDQAGLKPPDIDLIIVATVTPDRTFPSTAVYVQEKIGARPCIAFDVSAACSGFLYALNIAHNFISTGQLRHALIIGAEKLSCFLDWGDRSSSVLFGDGAGAMVLSAKSPRTARRPRGVLATYLSADGRLAKHLYADGGPSTTATVGKVRMNGKEVFRNAVEHISGAVFEVTERAKVSRHEIDWFVPHQANSRILSGTAKKTGVAMDRIVMTLDKHGNTSAASIPLALNVAFEDGRIKEGDLVLLEAMGGGFTWGAALLRW